MMQSPAISEPRLALTDSAGRYDLGPLPPGQYLFVAVDDFEETEIDERETLDQISPKAVPSRPRPSPLAYGDRQRARIVVPLQRRGHHRRLG